MNEVDTNNYILPIRINGWYWEIRFVSSEVIKHELGFDALGFTFVDRFTIDIVDSTNKEEVKLRLIHELTHAIICSQGRAFQNKFSQEDIANLVAWSYPTINEILKGFDCWWESMGRGRSDLKKYE